MISQVTVNPKSTTSNEYGFYAIPKTIKPKSKYRDNEYEEEALSKLEEPKLAPLTQDDDDYIQRDYFVDEPPFAEFVPKQAGVDEEVQVDEDELFDFDLEVESLLQILVGQAVFKSRNELQEQGEQKESVLKLEQYQKKRQAELMITQRLQAQNRRRNQQNDRRVLQHQVYTDQKKLVLRRLLTFNRSKKALLNLKEQVLEDLGRQGFLRHDIHVRIRSDFLPWLYDQIQSELVNLSSMTSAGQNIFNEKEDELKKKHKQHIQKEAQRRKEILDERETQRLVQEERKKKKTVRKERMVLNKIRIEKEDRIYEALGKAQKLDNIAKGEISDNYVRSRPTIFVSGGPLVFLSNVLQSLSQHGVNLTQEQLQNVIIKMLREFKFPLEVNLPTELKQRISSMEAESKVDPQAANHKLPAQVDSLADTQELICASYHQNQLSPGWNLKQIIKILLRVHLTQPLPTDKPKTTEDIGEGGDPVVQEPKHNLSEIQKSRVSVRGNLKLNFQTKNSKRPSQIIRVRFPHKRSEQLSQEEYIEVFDGEGWGRILRKYPEVQDIQTTTVITLPGFQTSIVYDEVSNSHYGGFLYNILTSAGITIQKAVFQDASNSFSQKHEQLLRQKFGSKETPIYDIECET